MVNLLILDDDEVLNNLFNRVLSCDNSVTSVYSFDEAVSAISKKKFDIILSDMKLPKGSGLEFLSIVKRSQKDALFIMMTGFADIQDAVNAMKMGATDYLIKPIDHIELQAKINALKENFCIKPVSNDIKDIFSQSTYFHDISKSIIKAAKTDTTILLTEETGTGKTLVAKYIHAISDRSKKQFFSINCANLQENIFESELFGYKKGAFTGAIQNKTGLVELAEKGTLFLDEVAEIPFNFQGKLLKFLDEKAYLPLGASSPQKANVRIIAATNKNLLKMMENNELRSDLFYRLNVITFHMPLLRERKKDIPALVNHFIKRHKNINEKITSISSNALEMLMNYDYKGNIRELANIIERAMILEESDQITTKHLKFGEYQPDTNNLALNEKSYILKILTQCNNDKSKTAEILNINRSTLYRKLKEYNIN